MNTHAIEFPRKIKVDKSTEKPITHLVKINKIEIEKTTTTHTHTQTKTNEMYPTQMDFERNTNNEDIDKFNRKYHAHIGNTKWPHTAKDIK